MSAYTKRCVYLQLKYRLLKTDFWTVCLLPKWIWVIERAVSNSTGFFRCLAFYTSMSAYTKRCVYLQLKYRLLKTDFWTVCLLPKWIWVIERAVSNLSSSIAINHWNFGRNEFIFTKSLKKEDHVNSVSQISVSTSAIWNRFRFD